MAQSLFWFSRYLNFCLDLSGHVAKRLYLKDKFNFKIYDVTAWLINIVIDILPNICRSKGNQKIFGQLIEYNMRNIFLEK